MPPGGSFWPWWLLRPLLKKLPRACACLLWALAAVRLLVPSVVKSPVSLMPQRVADPAAFIPITPTPMIAVPSAQAAAQAAAPAARSADQVISSLLPWLWLAGAVAMGLYALYSYIHLINRVKVSIRMGDRLYISDNVASPFILGIIRPKIYLPSEMDQDQAQLVLAHERSHLRRGDHLWKPLGYTLLCLHWFNPLCWVAYLLFCRDMEQACDEAVIKDMPAQEKKAYSTALLNCSLPRSAISACPLAFGEVGVKQRIRGVLNYRKPKFWVLVISGLVCVTLAACFLTDPVKGETPVAEPTGSGKETVSPNLDDFQIRFETTIYAYPTSESRAVGTLTPGEAYTIAQTENVGKGIWGHIHVEGSQIDGWILLGTEVDPSEGKSDTADAITSILAGAIRSNPSVGAQEIGQIDPDKVCMVLRREQIGNKQWAYVQPQRSYLLGWLLLNGEEETVSSAERFSQKTDIHSTPSEQSEVLYQADAGEEYTIIRREYVEGSCWVYVRTQNGAVVGWVYLKDESEALNYFWEYAIAHMREIPDAAEEYLYFATEDAREYFRYMYAPATGWATSGIFQVNENLWSIRFADIQSQQAAYSFVGRMDDRLYVFQTVHDVPEALRENLDVAAYEEPNAMYVSDEWKAGFLISTRLMAFAEPAQVEIAGDKDYSNASAGLSFADMVCGTDTWQKAELPQAGKAGCTITLHAADGSTAVLSDATPAIVVTYPDGTQEAYQDYATGEENIAMIYNWAKELAQ